VTAPAAPRIATDWTFVPLVSYTLLATGACVAVPPLLVTVTELAASGASPQIETGPEDDALFVIMIFPASASLVEPHRIEDIASCEPCSTRHIP
jgi:hypothetical protein